MKKTELCYMETDSFIVYIKSNDIDEDTAEDVETRFDNWNHKFDRPLPKVTPLMKEKLGGKIMTKFVRLRAKTYIVT